MRKKLLGLMIGISAICGVACEEEPTQTTTNFKSSDIPELIPYEGGTYTLSLEKIVKVIETKSQNADIAWAYRINYDEAEGEVVEFDKAAESVEITIEANHTASKRSVTVEFSSDATENWETIVSATQDLDPSKVKDVFSEFQSTNMPQTIGYNGGDYYFALKFRLEDPVLKSTAQTTFIPWAYRISVNGVAGKEVKIEEKTEKIDFHIEPNYSEKDVKISLELANNKELNNWSEVASAQQESAFIELGEEGITYFYAKADLVVKDGKFALADKPQESGYFFKHESIFGVPFDESYAGYAYNPEKVQIALSDIKANAGEDPCTALSPNLRLPSYEELSMLYYMEDTDNTSMVEGVNGVHYKGSDLFLPFSGYVNIASGSLMGKNQTGSWWGLGGNYTDNGLLITSNLEYSIAPSYDLVGENLASVRCVKNIKLPSYVSHEPAVIETCKETPITIVTDPGEFQLYEVGLESSKGAYTQVGATNNKTTVTIKLPENEEKEDVQWKLFVNSIFTGVTFTQPQMKDYVIFMSYSPKTAQDYNAFKLKVTIDTDRESVAIKAVGSNGLEVSETASKDNLSVELNIPENTEHKKVTWTIYIDGESTGKSIEQGPAPVAGLSVDWSEGFLTLKDGQYVFAEPTEKGAYFTWKSKYAILDVPYNGKAYGPEETKYKKLTDIPNSDVDPCSLVAPAGTWRMPSAKEVEELAACPFVATKNTDLTFTIPSGEKLVFVVGGQMSNSTGKLLMGTAASLFWTSDERDGDKTKAKYALFSTTTGSAKIAAGTAKTFGQQVRCVKKR